MEFEAFGTSRALEDRSRTTGPSAMIRPTFGPSERGACARPAPPPAPPLTDERPEDEGARSALKFKRHCRIGTPSLLD